MNIIHRDLNSHNCLVREVSSLGLGGRGSRSPAHHTPSLGAFSPQGFLGRCLHSN